MKIRSRNPILLCVLSLGLLATGHASAGTPTAIVSEADVATFWRPAPGVPKAVPGYPATAKDVTEDACVSIGYLLHADGSTSDFTLLNSWGANSPDSVRGRSRLTPYAQMGIAVVQRWKFVPAQAGNAKIRPVYTAASFAFSNNPAADKEKIRQHCAIANLPDFIARAQADAYRRGNLQKGRQERDRAENPPVISGH